VGQSDDVLIAGNVVHDNLLGIEIENSRGCSAVGNHAHGNTFGIFVDILPFLERPTQERAFVAFNSVHQNNRDNTAEPGELLGLLPKGIGILVAGGRSTTVLANDVRDNQYNGVSVVSFCLAAALQGVDCSALPLDIDPDPRDDRIVGNRVLGNGTVPVDDPLLDSFRSDLFWDQSGAGNCWSGNVFKTSVPSPLPACR
jgi:parallel beta-helix repeat protein